MIQGKQAVKDLMNDKDWTQHLPEGYSVELRIDSQTLKPRYDPFTGKVLRHTSDLQHYLGGGFVEEAFGSACKLVGPDGDEVRGIFKRF